MTQQGTDEKQGEDGTDASSAASSEGSPTPDAPAGESSSESSSESTGKHATTDAEATGQQAAADPQAEQPTQQHAAAPAAAQQSEQKPAEQKPAEQPTQRTGGQQGAGAARGQADTSWAEEEPKGRRSMPSVDVGELVWRTGNVVATVLRAIALLFALILIVNVVLTLVGVNPLNGVARFFAGVSDTVVLGFRDLFLSADPTIMLIVNSLVAAAFWVFVGELVSRVIRFLAARVK